MAGLSVETNFDFPEIKQLIKIFPDLNGRYLAFIGSKSRSILYKEHFSGQDITLRKFPRDSKGRYTVTSDVNKKRTEVKVYSYINNLFEKGRKLRDGSVQSGNFVVTKRLKQAIMSRKAGYTTEFETRILNNELKGINL